MEGREQGSGWETLLLSASSPSRRVFYLRMNIKVAAGLSDWEESPG